MFSTEGVSDVSDGGARVATDATGFLRDLVPIDGCGGLCDACSQASIVAAQPSLGHNRETFVRMDGNVRSWLSVGTAVRLCPSAIAMYVLVVNTLVTTRSQVKWSSLVQST